MTKSTSDTRTAPFAPEYARSDVRLTADSALTAGVAPVTTGDPVAAVSDLAARVAASIASKPLAEPAPGGFGATQRWTLTRLAFIPRDASRAPAPPTPGTPGVRRMLIVRPTFIAAADLAAWRHAPPADAHALPPDADAIVDGTTAEGATTFYAVLEAATPDDPSDPSDPST